MGQPLEFGQGSEFGMISPREVGGVVDNRGQIGGEDFEEDTVGSGETEADGIVVERIELEESTSVKVCAGNYRCEVGLLEDVLVPKEDVGTRVGLAVGPAHAPAQVKGIGGALVGDFPMGGEIREDFAAHRSPANEPFVGDSCAVNADITGAGAKPRPGAAVGAFLVWRYHHQGIDRQALVDRWKVLALQLGCLGKRAGGAGGPFGYLVEGAGPGGMAIWAVESGHGSQIGAANPGKG